MVAWLSSSSLSVTFVSMMLGGNSNNNNNNQEAVMAAVGASASSSSSSAPTSCRDSTNTQLVVTGLYRYAVTGLSADALPRVTFSERGATFPDDRRYALLFDDKKANFKPGKWLHKENFLCAFTAPKLLAQLESSYHRRIIVPSSSLEDDGDGDDNDDEDEEHKQKGFLTIRERSTGIELLPETNLATVQGRLELGDFLTKRCGQKVTCVTGDSTSTTSNNNNKQDFQFGNTSSGVKKNNGNTRTIHMVNENTIEQVSKKLGISLDPTRFRPNVVFRGPPAWSEFDWIDKCLQVVVDSGGSGSSGDLDNGDHDASHLNNSLQIRIISRTVRCQGVSVDPLLDDPNNHNNEVDIPGLLAKHFPQHGPYLGVYAVIESPGTLSVDQELSIVE